MRVSVQSTHRVCAVFALLLLSTPVLFAQRHPASAPRIELDRGWQMQDASKVSDAGSAVSSAAFNSGDWYHATVPGTALTTLVNEKVYPEPLYGENNRPETIPNDLAQRSWWYRTHVTLPPPATGRHIFLNFDGINYSSEVWVNGAEVGTTRGAFVRSRFDITGNVRRGRTATIAVLVHPQPHPGMPHEHTLRDGVGRNGGASAEDGPTFLSTLGWDWLAPVRDRDTGMWARAYLDESGPVRVEDPLITTDLPLPRTDSADLAVSTTVENLTDELQAGMLTGEAGGIHFERSVTLEPHSRQVVRFDPSTDGVLHIANPQLWWPNGYGPQNLQRLRLRFVQRGRVSDMMERTFGIRKITYSVPDSDNLTISVNGVRVFIRGGNWGLDEAMKRIPRERLEAQIRMHALANLNMIRNWVGQSTNDDFYELCDKYGMLLWDEFFQPNPNDGPDPSDLDTYLVNVRDKVLRYRDHPSIAVWCARNEGYPPKYVEDPLRKLMAELEPVRLYQLSSTEGHGVSSHGPYHWREPRLFYEITEAFKTETGSMSVPTLESIRGMMPTQDLSTINDDWAQHDFAKGAQGGDTYPGQMAARYGTVRNLQDFVRKAQMMNYEAYRAMYEGRNSTMFKTTTGVLTWMSHPAQPSFTWQLYHYDFEAHSSFYAVKSASEPLHVQWNEATNAIEVVNNHPVPLDGAQVKLTVMKLDGTVLSTEDRTVTVPASTTATFGSLAVPAGVGPVVLVSLQLRDASGIVLSRNIYWRAPDTTRDDLRAIETMAPVALDASATRADAGGESTITITLRNATAHPALMTHLQLRRADGSRVLPVFASENYVSLLPGESRTVALTAKSSLIGATPSVAVDGWNVSVTESTGVVRVTNNADAQAFTGPETGLPFATTGLR